MDSETRAAFAALSDTVVAGFARVDRYFELQQLQFVELRDRVDALAERVDALTERVDALTERVDALTERVSRLEHEVLLLRDYVTREFAEVRAELRDLRNNALNADDDLRRDVAALTVRVERLEERQRE